MQRFVKRFGGLAVHSDLSASVTVIAMLIAGVFAKLDNARIGLIVIVLLCVLHLAHAIGDVYATPAAKPGE
jgi:hypothetical protein